MVAETVGLSSGFEPLSCKKTEKLRDLGLEERKELGEVENSGSQHDLTSQEPTAEPMETNGIKLVRY